MRSKPLWPVAKKGLLYLLLAVLAIPFLFPFWWMITSAFKPVHEIFAFPPTLWPSEWRWSNFAQAFTHQPFALHYLNSIYIAILVTVGTVIISSLSGYAFARIKFRGAPVLFVLLMITLMMPSEVTIIPNFQLMTWLGWHNSHIPLIVVPILGAGGVMGTYMMRQFFLGFPREIEEAATVDGLSRPGVFWRIAMPIARPSLAALSVLAFLGSWNAFLEPLVYLNDLHLFTLPLSLRNFNDGYGLPIWNVQLAATTMAILPILIIYVVAQKQIVQSFTLSGTKG
ncbi:MAG TPA: carbohydrate ABC transporter permease [Symbiobacteriaceae bacterium]|nr:carbohydrate ABC transporter permease [Symbiobacteriaceae bacterium]